MLKYLYLALTESSLFLFYSNCKSSKGTSNAFKDGSTLLKSEVVCSPETLIPFVFSIHNCHSYFFYNPFYIVNVLFTVLLWLCSFLIVPDFYLSIYLFRKHYKKSSLLRNLSFRLKKFFFKIYDFLIVFIYTHDMVSLLFNFFFWKLFSEFLPTFFDHKQLILFLI